MNRLIYAADDDVSIRNLIKTFLVKEGYEVEVFENGDALLEAFITRQADLVILDVMMPGSDGFSICSAIRQRSTVPIIMLTARDTDADYYSGITLGSDDYFVKPVSPIKLTLRVKAILRRIDMDKGKDETDSIVYGDLKILPQEMTAYCKEKELPFTMTEYNLLLYFLQNSSRAISRKELLNKIWGFDSIVETRATDDTVKRLRKKLSDFDSAVVIDTIWGYGFKINKKEKDTDYDKL